MGIEKTDNIKTLIDNLLIYTNNGNHPTHKILIHCLAGIGRTGIIACCIIAVLVFIKNNIKLKNKLDKIRSKYDSILINIKLNKLAKYIFILSQIYIMTSVRLYRENSLTEIVIPETNKQEQIIIKIIYMYLIYYIDNGQFSF